mmetsp:Transcript_43607/g.102823  ORF Transcript_43607/g.102823 Transcript_43607/m.102823 type:complete len:188 (+) Transcript_43607:134-697(+)
MVIRAGAAANSVSPSRTSNQRQTRQLPTLKAADLSVWQKDHGRRAADLTPSNRRAAGGELNPLLSRASADCPRHLQDIVDAFNRDNQQESVGSLGDLKSFQSMDRVQLQPEPSIQKREYRVTFGGDTQQDDVGPVTDMATYVETDSYLRQLDEFLSKVAGDPEGFREALLRDRVRRWKAELSAVFDI